MSRFLLAAALLTSLALVAPLGSSARVASALNANGRIAFVNTTGIASMNPDGSGQWGVELNVGDNAPAWSPDGTQLAVATQWAGNYGILDMQPDGSGAHMLTTDGSDRDPAWSPGGTLVAVANSANLWLVNADGSGRSQLTFDPENRDVERPTWSPDGTKIAFAAYLYGGGVTVIVDDLAKGTETPLTAVGPTEYASSPAWSPDGTQIAFQHNSGIWVMAADGSGAKALTSGSWDSSPAWSPDGTQIAFSRNGQIWAMARDGSGAHQLTNDTDGASQPAWQPLAAGPAGCTIWGTSANDLLVGGDGNDVICGLDGNDTLIGLGGNDRLYGGGNDDFLAGGTGHDVLSGGDGNDTLDARNGSADGVAGGGGYDTAVVSGLGNRLNGIDHLEVNRDLAVWRPATADASNSTNPPVRAFDGSFTDWWNSGGYPSHWIEVDLQSPQAIARLNMVAPETPSAATFVVLGRAHVDQPFRLLHVFNGPTADLEQLDFTPKHPWRGIRYVRVVVPMATGSMPWVSWHEISLYPPVAHHAKKKRHK